MPCSSETGEKSLSASQSIKGIGMVEGVCLGCNITGRFREAACTLEPLILEENLLMICHVCSALFSVGALTSGECFAVESTQVTLSSYFRV